MRYLKKYNIFESSYNKEEFHGYIVRELSKYNIRPVVLNKILDQYDDQITKSVESGEDPKSMTDEIIKNMNLNNDEGFPTVRMGDTISKNMKYL